MDIEDIIKHTVSDITKKFGQGSMMTMDSSPDCDIKDWISTGSAFINNAIGKPGIPVGRLTLIVGKPEVGKTTLITHLIAETQKKGGIAALFDTEHSFDPTRAKGIGVDLSKLLFSQPSCFEDVFGRIEVLSETVRKKSDNIPCTIIWDTVSSSPTKTEMEADPGELSKIPAEHARVMASQLRKTTELIDKNKVALVFVNQIKSKVGVMFGSPETFLAEAAQRFHASLILKISRKKVLETGKKAYGIKSKVAVLKNKFSPPFRIAEIDILFNGGIDEYNSLLENAVKLDKVTLKSGGWYQFGSRTFKRDEWKGLLDKMPDLRKELETNLLGNVEEEE